VVCGVRDVDAIEAGESPAPPWSPPCTEIGSFALTSKQDVVKSAHFAHAPNLRRVKAARLKRRS
jgi:hypothetical protein